MPAISTDPVQENVLFRWTGFYNDMLGIATVEDQTAVRVMDRTRAGRIRRRILRDRDGKQGKEKGRKYAAKLRGGGGTGS